MRQSDKISRHHIRGMTPHIWTVGAVPGRSGMFSTQSPCSLRAGGRGNKKDGERSADEKRWGMSRAELKKRTAPLQRRHGYSEDWQDARHRDGIGARGSDGAAAPFRRR